MKSQIGTLLKQNALMLVGTQRGCYKIQKAYEVGDAGIKEFRSQRDLLVFLSWLEVSKKYLAKLADPSGVYDFTLEAEGHGKEMVPVVEIHFITRQGHGLTPEQIVQKQESVSRAIRDLCLQSVLWREEIAAQKKTRTQQLIERLKTRGFNVIIKKQKPYVVFVAHASGTAGGVLEEVELTTVTQVNKYLSAHLRGYDTAEAGRKAFPDLLGVNYRVRIDLNRGEIDYEVQYFRPE